MLDHLRLPRLLGNLLPGNTSVMTWEFTYSLKKLQSRVLYWCKGLNTFLTILILLLFIYLVFHFLSGARFCPRITAEVYVPSVYTSGKFIKIFSFFLNPVYIKSTFVFLLVNCNSRLLYFYICCSMFLNNSSQHLVTRLGEWEKKCCIVW